MGVGGWSGRKAQTKQRDQALQTKPNQAMQTKTSTNKQTKQNINTHKKKQAIQITHK